MNRPQALSAVVALLLALVGGAAAAQTRRTPITLGIVYDGADPTTGRAPPGRLVELPIRILEETIKLTRRDFDVRAPEDKRLSGGWTKAGINAAIDRLLADPEVDIVLTLGVFGTDAICRRGALPKPAVAPFVVDVVAQGLPQTVDEDGRAISGVGNLTYVTTPGSVMRDVIAFRELAPFDTLHIVADLLEPEAIPELRGSVIASGRAEGIEMVLVAAVDTADSVLDALPDDAEAVYLTPLHRMPPGEFGRLVEGLKQRGLPSFSLIGRSEVEAGVYAGIRPGEDWRRLTRRVALNIQRILMGEDPGSMPVDLELADRLVINMQTASAIKVFPSVTVVLDAELIGLGGELDETLTLGAAVERAIASNVGLESGRAAVAAGAAAVRRTRSALLPRADLGTSWLQVDSDTAASSFGQQAERTLSAGVEISQPIYSEDLRAGVSGSRSSQRSTEQDWETDRLDVASDAATAFINVLRAEVLERVERENLRVTGTNLALARRRQEVGFSGPADVYRWESQLATDKASLIAAHADVHLALVQLNRVLHRPLEDVYVVEPPALAQPDMVTGFGRLSVYVGNAASFGLFKDFMVEQGLAGAPELRSLDALIEARQREKTAARRSFWAPEVGWFGSYSRDISREGEGSAGGPSGAPPERNGWNVGLEAGLPLFAGGDRRARYDAADAALRELRLQRVAVAERIEQRIRTSLYRISASFPAIGLARSAADTASSNLELVTDSYRRGAVSVIELLDAQNAALRASGAAASAVYDFLQDLMELQRSSSEFDFFRDESERDVWFDELQRYFAENQDRMAWPRR